MIWSLWAESPNRVSRTVQTSRKTVFGLSPQRPETPPSHSRQALLGTLAVFTDVPGRRGCNTAPQLSRQTAWPKSLHSERGQKLNTDFCFSNFSGAPGYSGKNFGISRQKVWYPWASKDILNFLAPTPHVKEPHPTRRYPDQKVWVWVPFSSLI